MTRAGAVRWSRSMALGTTLAALGCGGAPPPPVETGSDDASGSSRPRGSGIGVESEIGALDEAKAQQAFERSTSKLSACFQKGAQRLPYLAGSVSFYVRVAGDGTARYVYVRDSSLGDRQTEECMLGVLKATSWPRPEGGSEGEARNEFNFDPGSDERPPVEWSPEQLGKPFAQARPALAQCRQSAGTGPVKATLYVETDGKPAAIGASSADDKGEHAIACIIRTLQAITFPSPGSYASKVSVVID